METTIRRLAARALVTVLIAFIFLAVYQSAKADGKLSQISSTATASPIPTSSRR